MANRKNSYAIELKEKTDEMKFHPTNEEERKIIPKEVKNLKFVIKNYPAVSKYTWEKDGDKLTKIDVISYTRDDRKILKYLFLKQMPDKFRPEYWLIASGAKQEMINNPGYYKDLSKNFPLFIPSPFQGQIEVDLKRTFPDDPFFREENNIVKLKNVLLAYSRRNMAIGYCQGFNFIVGRLLKIYYNEEEAFWVFVQLIENILPINYYSELAGIMVDCTILIKLLKIYLPTLYNHLLDIGYELSLNNIIYKWFVSIYIQNLSLELSLIVWDMLFLEGNIIMFKSALAILKVIKNDIQKTSEIEEINAVFEENTRHLNDSSTLIYYLILRKFSFDDIFIEKNRISLQSTIIENIYKNNEKKINKDGKTRASYVNSDVECYPDWPLCIYDLDYKYSVINYLCYKIQDKPTIIDDYFFEHNSKNYKIRKKSKSSQFKSLKIKTNDKKNKSFDNSLNSRKDIDEKYEIYKNLLIERRKHFCEPDNIDESKNSFDSDSFNDLHYSKDYKISNTFRSSLKAEISIPNKENINYPKFLSSLRNTEYEHIFESLMPATEFPDMEDYDI